MIRKILQRIISLPMISILIIMLLLTGCESQNPQQKKEPCELTFLDTGKSDCIIIEMDGKTILNDTADKDDYRLIQQTLEDKGVEKIDYLIISHFDKDHIGSAPQLIRNYEIGCVIMPDFWGDSYLYQDMVSAIQETGTEQMKLDESYEFSTGKGKVSIDAPELSEYDDENNYSLITSVTYGEKNFLLMGDALKQRTEEFVDRMSTDTKYDLVKTPHHGDYNKKLKSIFEQGNVSAAVITAAGDETIETKLMSLLEENNVDIYVTYNGTVVAKTDGKTLTISQDS